MRMKKVIWSLVISIVAVGSLFANGQSEEASGKTTVKFWRHHAPAFNETYDKMAADYMAANPDIMIVTEGITHLNVTVGLKSPKSFFAQ